MFSGVTTYELTLCDLLPQQSALSKDTGQTSSGLKFSGFFSVLSFLAWAATFFFLSFEFLLWKMVMHLVLKLLVAFLHQLFEAGGGYVLLIFLTCLLQ